MQRARRTRERFHGEARQTERGAARCAMANFDGSRHGVFTRRPHILGLSSRGLRIVATTCAITLSTGSVLGVSVDAPERNCAR
jgi:hypothetical protein